MFVRGCGRCDQDERTRGDRLARLSSSSALAAAMFLFGFALAAALRRFCEVTGFSGRTASAGRQPPTDPPRTPSRAVRVEFIASVAERSAVGILGAR